MQSGIYRIVNWINSKVYVGSASYLRKRISDHKCSLAKNNHDNPYLQNAWNKYGATNFNFEVLEYCSKEALISKEQYWIDKLNCIIPNGYNIAPIAGNTAGVKWTEEQRAKYLAKRIGSKRSQEEKDKISLGMKGKKNRLNTLHSKETRIKMGDAQRRRHRTDINVSNVLTMENGKWR